MHAKMLQCYWSYWAILGTVRGLGGWGWVAKFIFAGWGGVKFLVLV